MKVLKVFAAALLTGFCSVASANFVDTILIHEKLTAGGTNESWSGTFDITDDGYTPFDFVFNARIDVWFHDDDIWDQIFADHSGDNFLSLGDGPEVAGAEVGFFSIDLGITEVDGNFFVPDSNTYAFELIGGLVDFFVLVDIFLDGKLDIIYTATLGDFNLRATRLTVNEAPEPASIALLAISMIGLSLGMARRRTA